MALIGFVMLYMLATIAIGLYAATRVSSTSDFALAGRSLPLPMVITATFATWFGSETILGLPGRFIESGIVGVIEEPFGSGMSSEAFSRTLDGPSISVIVLSYKKRVLSLWLRERTRFF